MKYWIIWFCKHKRNSFQYLYFSDDRDEREIEIKLEISKKAGLLKKPVNFEDVPGRIDEVTIRRQGAIQRHY